MGMASFQSHPLTLFRQTLSSLFLIFVLIFSIIHPSCGDHEDESVSSQDLLIEIRNHVSNHKFRADTLFNTVATAPASASSNDLANAALRRAQSVAIDIQTAITSLLENYSSISIHQQDSQLLERCQIDNNKAITEISSASNGMNSGSIIDIMYDLMNAANATQNCQDIIQGTPISSILNRRNMDLIMYCDLAVLCLGAQDINQGTPIS